MRSNPKTTAVERWCVDSREKQRNSSSLLSSGGTLDRVLRRCNHVEPDSVNPQVRVEGHCCVLGVGKRHPNEVVHAVFAHRSWHRNSVLLETGRKLGLAHRRWQVGDENCGHRVHHCLHWSRRPVLLGDGLVLVHGLVVVVVDGNGLVSDHGLSSRRDGPLPGDSPRRASPSV